MENHEDAEIVIVGAGLAGLTTAFTGNNILIMLPSLVGFEKFGAGVIREFENYRICPHTMDQCLEGAVGIGESLRQKSTQMKGFKIASSDTGLFTSEQALDKDGKFEGYESRCVKRKDLLEALVNELPPGTIRYSSKVTNIDELDWFKLVHLTDGSILKTKVLIGCDGVNSVVAKWLGLEKPVSVGRSAIRGLVEFPNGSGFDPMFHVNFGGGVRFGFLPVDDNSVYWFCTFTPSQVSSYEEDWQENPMKMKQFVLSRINKMPQEAQNVVEKTSLNSISIAQLKFRLPWKILFGNIMKDNVCVAGDALHPMTPDIGQGGCSSLEDAVVLGRCIGEALLKKSSEENDEFERIKKGLEKYRNERRWRSFSLVSVAYCVGFMQESKGKVFTFLRKVWFSKYTPSAFLKMANFDCGDLVF